MPQQRPMQAKIYAIRFDRADRDEIDTIYLRAYSRDEAEDWLRRSGSASRIYPPRQRKNG